MEELVKILQEKKIISGKELSEYLSNYDIVVSCVFYNNEDYCERRWNDDSVVEVIDLDRSLLKVNIDCVDCKDCENCFKCISCVNCNRCVECVNAKDIFYESNIVI